MNIHIQSGMSHNEKQENDEVWVSNCVRMNEVRWSSRKSQEKKKKKKMEITRCHSNFNQRPYKNRKLELHST